MNKIFSIYWSATTQKRHWTENNKYSTVGRKRKRNVLFLCHNIATNLKMPQLVTKWIEHKLAKSRKETENGLESPITIIEWKWSSSKMSNECKGCMDIRIWKYRHDCWIVLVSFHYERFLIRNIVYRCFNNYIWSYIYMMSLILNWMNGTLIAFGKE